MKKILPLFIALLAASLFAKQPNIVLVLQDDQDLYMGAWDGRGTATKGPMRQASHLIGDRGATASNWFIHTPICCPSRSELVTGRYFHNLKVNCSTTCSSKTI